MSTNHGIMFQSIIILSKNLSEKIKNKEPLWKGKYLFQKRGKRVEPRIRKTVANYH
jgi:hypothetical protein